MKEIPLTRGKVTVVDDDDFDRLSQVKWHYSPEGYARNSWSLGYMHRAIMGAPTGMEIDHIDGNKLNNTKANLRICTGQQNDFNRQWKRPRAQSRFKGVRIGRNGIRWQAGIRVNRKEIYIGTFDSEEEAAQAYDVKARELFGEFACCNFKQDPA